ncbi:MAG: hypothetical protein IJQ39_12205 [Thermoguttaceae bacterium]|nr:hypothetical protein [Thermoguttaceae bacterium]
MEGGNEVNVAVRAARASGCGFASEKAREAARAVGQGYASERAFFGATRFQSGTDLVERNYAFADRRTK